MEVQLTVIPDDEDNTVKETEVQDNKVKEAIIDGETLKRYVAGVCAAAVTALTIRCIGGLMRSRMQGLRDYSKRILSKMGSFIRYEVIIIIMTKCLKCGHEWETRSKLTYVNCPSCRRPVKLKDGGKDD